MLGIMLDFCPDRVKINPYHVNNFPRCTSFQPPIATVEARQVRFKVGSPKSPTIRQKICKCLILLIFANIEGQIRHPLNLLHGYKS
jgi:hypothetical protein